MTSLEIFTAVRDAIAEIPYDQDNDPAGEKLLQAVELFPNKQIGSALQSLLKATAKRAAIVVPLSIRRTVNDRSGGLSVLGSKYAEVVIIYSDVAYFKSEQTATFGGDKNLGLFTFDEKIEAALTGKEISPFGGIIFGDSDPLLLSDGEQKNAPGRQAWMIQAFVPVGLIASAVF